MPVRQRDFAARPSASMPLAARPEAPVIAMSEAASPRPRQSRRAPRPPAPSAETALITQPAKCPLPPARTKAVAQQRLPPPFRNRRSRVLNPPTSFCRKGAISSITGRSAISAVRMFDVFLISAAVKARRNFLSASAADL